MLNWPRQATIADIVLLLLLPVCPQPPTKPPGYIPYSGPQSCPLTFATEFKRPTPLPAKLQAVVDASAVAGKLPVKACVLTGTGEKEVIVGTLSNV
jgi:hypothetical protein